MSHGRSDGLDILGMIAVMVYYGGADASNLSICTLVPCSPAYEELGFGDAFQKWYYQPSRTTGSGQSAIRIYSTVQD